MTDPKAAEKAKELYEFINANEDSWLEVAQDSNIEDSNARIMGKVAAQSSEDEFVEFMTSGNLEGAVSLTDEEMEAIHGGGWINVNLNVKFSKRKKKDVE